MGEIYSGNERKATDPKKRRFLSNKIKLATWEKGKLKDALWGKL